MSAPDRPDLDELERLREMVMLRVPDGFRDDYGVWHPGPHRITALGDLDALASRVETLTKEYGRHAEVVADYVAQLKELDRERFDAETQVETLREALREIESAATSWPMPSQLNRLAGIAETAQIALEGARDE